MSNNNKLQHIIVLDLETGGLDENKNPITQYACKVLEPVKFNVVYQRETYVKPYESLKKEKLIIEQQAIKSSQIDVHALDKGMLYTTLIKEIEDMIKEYTIPGRIVIKPILAGHNVGFDRRFLRYLFKLKSKNFDDLVDDMMFDTLRLMRNREAGRAKANEVVKYNLTAICERLGITLRSAHGAPADVDATIEVLKLLLLGMRGELATEASPGEKPIKDRQFFQFKLKK